MYQLHLKIQDGTREIPAGAGQHPEGDTWQDNTGADFGFGWPQGSEYWIKIHRIGLYVTRPGTPLVTGYPDRGVPRRVFREFFFHTVARWLLQTQDWDCLHGSSVLIGGGVLAFCGPPSRGKSTLARAWRDRGAVVYADDAVPFLLKDGQVLSGSLPQPLRLRGVAASAFRGPAPPEGGESENPESWHDLEPTLRPLRCVYWLEPMAETTEGPLPILKRVPPADAFSLLLSEAHCMSVRHSSRNRKMVQNYLALANSVPVFRLWFARDLNRLPALLDLLDRNHAQLAAV
jgi:hypothetical protein